MGRWIVGGCVVAGIVTSLLLGLLAVQQTKLTDVAYLALLSILILCLLVALSIAGGAGILWVSAQFRPYRIRNPLIRRDAPNPYQWLIDIAQKHFDNPGAHVSILDRRIAHQKLEPGGDLPSISIGLTLRNEGVYTILIGPAEGHLMVNGNQLRDPVDPPGGSWSRYQHMHAAEHISKQTLPQDVADAMKAEIERTGELRGIDLTKIRLTVKSEAPAGRTVTMPVGNKVILSQ